MKYEIKKQFDRREYISLKMTIIHVSYMLSLGPVWMSEGHVLIRILMGLWAHMK